MRVLFEGGPDRWDGTSTKLVGAGRAERTASETDDEWVIAVYERTDRIVPVDVRRRRRADVVTEAKPAVVYALASYRRVSKHVSRAPAEEQLALV